MLKHQHVSIVTAFENLSLMAFRILPLKSYFRNRSRDVFNNLLTLMKSDFSPFRTRVVLYLYTDTVNTPKVIPPPLYNSDHYLGYHLGFYPEKNRNQAPVVQIRVNITQGQCKFSIQIENLNNKFSLILLVCNQVIECSKKNREYFPRKCLKKKQQKQKQKQKKESRGKI